MLEQYHKEVSQIHASSELIQRTKAAMKQEEKRLKENEELQWKENSRQRRNSRFQIKKVVLPLSVAAALVLLVGVTGVSLKVDSQTDTEIQMPVQLGQKEEDQLVEIGSSQKMQLIEAAEMPAEFADAAKVKKDGAVYYILQSERAGEWKAYIEVGEEKYLISGRAEAEEDFFKQIEALLAKK